MKNQPSNTSRLFARVGRTIEKSKYFPQPTIPVVKTQLVEKSH